MAALTEAQRRDFAKWMKGTLQKNEAAINAARPGVRFDCAAYVRQLEAKETQNAEAEKEITAAQTALKQANAAANATLSALYDAASDVADAVVGHVGKKHAFAKEIRDKRDSYANEAARGKEKTA